jgi:ABC-2 type transport system ATP-binding protein
MDIALHIQHISTYYGKDCALHTTSLSLPAGQCLCLIGHNGAGKSTLIKSILNFVPLHSGQINIFNRDHRDRHSRENLAYLPEKFIAPYYLTGRQFITWMLNAYQVKTAPQLLPLCEQIHLAASALDKPIKNLSKGMAQKIGLLACLLSEKPLLLLDEPLSGLDPEARILIKQQLKQHLSAGRSLFLSTHMLADVEQLADQIALLHQGKLLFYGSLTEFYQRYESDDLEQAYWRAIQVS